MDSFLNEGLRPPLSIRDPCASDKSSWLRPVRYSLLVSFYRGESPTMGVTADPARSQATMTNRHQTRTKLCLDVLEDRVVPSTFTVSNVADSGAGSLRQAILDADASG